MVTMESFFYVPGRSTSIKLQWQALPNFFRDRTLQHLFFFEQYSKPAFGHLQLMMIAITVLLITTSFAQTEPVPIFYREIGGEINSAAKQASVL